MAKLNFDKQEAEFLDKTISHWETDNLIDRDTAGKLKSSYEVKGFDWRRLAQYSFWVALACGIVAIASLIIDDVVIIFFGILFTASSIAFLGKTFDNGKGHFSVLFLLYLSMLLSHGNSDPG